MAGSDPLPQQFEGTEGIGVSLVGQGLVRGRARQELAHPAHTVRSGPLLHQLCFQEKLAELLQRRIQFPHG